jgi:hypothetical protein
MRINARKLSQLLCPVPIFEIHLRGDLSGKLKNSAVLIPEKKPENSYISNCWWLSHWRKNKLSAKIKRIHLLSIIAGSDEL